MRKIMYVVSSVAAALLVSALFSAQAGRPALAAKAGELSSRVTPAGSSIPLNSPQNKPFIWVSVDEENQFPGYKRVIGGKHNDGTILYICKAHSFFQIVGKLYKDECLVPFGGKEWVYSVRGIEKVQVFLTNSQYSWKAVHDLSHAQIQNDAVNASWDPASKSAIYVCRKQLQDGLHPGKYAGANGLCYISWGGKELYWADGFEILFP